MATIRRVTARITMGTSGATDAAAALARCSREHHFGLAGRDVVWSDGSALRIVGQVGNERPASQLVSDPDGRWAITIDRGLMTRDRQTVVTRWTQGGRAA